MAQFRNDLGYDVEVPTLARLVTNGEVIDAPDDFVCAGFTLVTDTPSSKAKKISDDAPAVTPVVTPTETTDATGEASVASATVNP